MYVFIIRSTYVHNSHSIVMIKFPDFRDISSEYRPFQQYRYKTKCMLFLTSILIYSLIAMTTIFYIKTLASKQLLSCIFCDKNNTCSNWPHTRTHFPWLSPEHS